MSPSPITLHFPPSNLHASVSSPPHHILIQYLRWGSARSGAAIDGGDEACVRRHHRRRERRGVLGGKTNFQPDRISDFIKRREAGIVNELQTQINCRCEIAILWIRMWSNFPTAGCDKNRVNSEQFLFFYQPGR